MVETVQATLVGLLDVVVEGRAIFVALLELLMIITVALSLISEKDVATHWGVSGKTAHMVPLPTMRAHSRSIAFNKCSFFIVVIILIC